MQKPEVKSPAGHWPQLHAAVEAGADAVYFGLSHFTARAKTGFTLEELPEAMRTLHRRGVKGYVTYNTLVFDDELKECARGLGKIAESGVDAIIVQDWGVVKLAREITPGLAIHGSTQMSVTDAAGVKHAQSLGVDRLILARELSLDEIRKVRAATDAELEIFCHGALCVSYSGQCFSSEAWGGRSANRGQCAQACRLEYDLIVDGLARPLSDARYLLSPGDLYALEQIPEIVDIGISAIKIEGRYKDATYVALATRAYRKAVDDACAGRAHDATVEREELEQVFSRGLGPWFLSGTNHQTVVRGRTPRHRGVFLGRVVKVTPDQIVVSGETFVKPGDGVVFDAADWRSPTEAEEGGRVYQAESAGQGLSALRFANGAIDATRIRPGDLVWRTSSPEIENRANAYLDASIPVHKQMVDVEVRAHVGEPLHMKWALPSGESVSVEAAAVLEQAHSRALTEEYLRAQLERLGNTPYQLQTVSLDQEGSPLVPSSLLNQLRRKAVKELEALQTRGPRIEIAHDPESTVDGFTKSVKPGLPESARLHLLVRTPEQLEAALSFRPSSITLDYLDLYGLRPSIERVKDAGIDARVASPRILKPGEERIADFLLRCECPILVRSAGLLRQLQGKVRLFGDFSLNAANAISANALLDMGLERLAPSHDLNAAQITALATRAGANRLEVIAYQHLPVFHTEHCVFCRFLSSGTSYKDCGRPCESHKVALRDRQGRPHPVMADTGCRNTVFGAEAQEASAHLQGWLATGIRHYRLEFVHEDEVAVVRVARAFSRALNGELPPGSLKQELRAAAPEGITEGSLLVPASSTLLPILR